MHTVDAFLSLSLKPSLWVFIRLAPGWLVDVKREAPSIKLRVQSHNVFCVCVSLCATCEAFDKACVLEENQGCTRLLLLGPCKTGKFSLRPYQNDYGN